MSDIPSWSESNTQTFLDFGRYFVPDREDQIEIICSLLLLKQAPAQVVELCWNFFRYPEDELDHPSTLSDQLKWLEQAGFAAIEVHYFRARHVIFSGLKV